MGGWAGWLAGWRGIPRGVGREEEGEAGVDVGEGGVYMKDTGHSGRITSSFLQIHSVNEPKEIDSFYFSLTCCSSNTYTLLIIRFVCFVAQRGGIVGRQFMMFCDCMARWNR